MRSWLTPGRFVRDIADVRAGRDLGGACTSPSVERQATKLDAKPAPNVVREPLKGVSEKREIRSAAPESWRENAHREPLVEAAQAGTGLLRKLVGDELLTARPRP
jgi:hypothetical protein